MKDLSQKEIETLNRIGRINLRWQSMVTLGFFVIGMLVGVTLLIAGANGAGDLYVLIGLVMIILVPIFSLVRASNLRTISLIQKLNNVGDTQKLSQ